MKNIAVVGGDMRNRILEDLLRDGGDNVFSFALGDEENGDFLSVINRCDYVITPTPFSKDGEVLFCPLSDKRVLVDEFVRLVREKVVFGGAIKNDIVEKLKKCNRVFDFMKDEEVVVKNAIPTAEGVVKLIIDNTCITIDDSRVAVLGFGRVGKRVARVLKCLGADVFCCDSKKEEVANIEMCGYNVVDENFNLKNMDVIVNTVPHLILGETELKSLDKNKTLIIDVASNPGGVDYEYANANKFRCIHELGIPGKIAARTSAIYIRDFIKNVINEV